MSKPHLSRIGGRWFIYFDGVCPSIYITRASEWIARRNGAERP